MSREPTNEAAVASTPVQVLPGEGGPELPSVVSDGGRAWAVVWPGTGARLRSMHRISLSAGGQTRPLRHPGEAVYYVIEGEGEVEDLDEARAESLVQGSMVHVGPETPYVLRAGDRALELLGGPSPPDAQIYEGGGA